MMTHSAFLPYSQKGIVPGYFALINLNLRLYKVTAGA